MGNRSGPIITHNCGDVCAMGHDSDKVKEDEHTIQIGYQSCADNYSIIKDGEPIAYFDYQSWPALLKAIEAFQK
jgi:hypothetical protein